MATTNGTIAVIGGGLAGLTAAAYAARSGAAVRLFEKAGELGGRAATQVRDGFTYNYGPHALYNGGQAAAVLDELGISYTGDSHRRPLALERAGDGSAIFVSREPAPGANNERARLFAEIAAADASQLQGTKITDWIRATWTDEDARRQVAAFLRLSTYANAPEIQSAGAAIDQLRMAAGGVTYLDDGWGVLTRGLGAVAREAGATFATGQRATAVRASADGWRVTSAGGETMDAAAVVLAGSPADAAQLTEGAVAATLGGWAAEAVAVRACCLDIALRALPCPEATFAVGIDRPHYLSVHSAVARLAPEGQALVSLAKYLAPGDHGEGAEAELEALLDAVQPGWRGEVLQRRSLPNIAVTQANVTAAAGGLAGRPGPEVPGAPGLFVAGDWVGPEGQLSDAAFASGKAAAGLAVAAGSRRLAVAV